jgi:hypothetical protein
VVSPISYHHLNTGVRDVPWPSDMGEEFEGALACLLRGVHLAKVENVDQVARECDDEAVADSGHEVDMFRERMRDCCHAAAAQGSQKQTVQSQEPVMTASAESKEEGTSGATRGWERSKTEGDATGKVIMVVVVGGKRTTENSKSDVKQT